MTGRTVTARPITPEGFAPFGDVISTAGGNDEMMNDARFTRYRDLAGVDVAGRAALSIIRSRQATPLPYEFELLERHPLGSQAFIPLARAVFVVVVAPRGDVVDIDRVRAFVTDGSQGVNYARGVWHMPLIALEEGQEFLVVDRAAGEDGVNYEELRLDAPVTLQLGDGVG